MKVIDLLKIQREPLKVMSDCGLKVDDYGYIVFPIDLYKEMCVEYIDEYTATYIIEYIKVIFM